MDPCACVHWSPVRGVVDAAIPAARGLPGGSCRDRRLRGRPDRARPDRPAARDDRRLEHEPEARHRQDEAEPLSCLPVHGQRHGLRLVPGDGEVGGRLQPRLAAPDREGRRRPVLLRELASELQEARALAAAADRRERPRRALQAGRQDPLQPVTSVRRRRPRCGDTVGDSSSPPRTHWEEARRSTTAARSRSRSRTSAATSSSRGSPDRRSRRFRCSPKRQATSASASAARSSRSPTERT